MPADTRSIEKDLRAWLSGARRVVVAGVGNSLRKDDCVGVKIVRNLRGKVSRNVFLTECETIPESHLEPIVEFKPTHVLVLDAALLNLKPGASKLVEPSTIPGVSVLSHALPLKVFSDYVVRVAGARVGLLAIQPKETDFGEGLTEELRRAADALADLLSEVLP